MLWAAPFALLEVVVVVFCALESRGAEYPSEHNVGHEYVAKKDLLNFYKELDPTNSFNSGIGFSSKNKFWK